MTRQDEILNLARETSDDGDAFMAGLVGLARQDITRELTALRDLDPETDLDEIHEHARKLASASALVLGEGRPA